MVALVTLAVHSANNLFQKSNLEGLTNVMCDPYFVWIWCLCTKRWNWPILRWKELSIQDISFENEI